MLARQKPCTGRDIFWIRYQHIGDLAQFFRPLDSMKTRPGWISLGCRLHSSIDIIDRATSEFTHRFV